MSVIISSDGAVSAAPHSVQPISREDAVLRYCTIEALESRQLMSLTIDLRLAGGGKDITVDHVGQIVNLEAWAIVKGNNADISDDGLQIAVGSVLSTNVGGGSALGDLTATPAAPFNSFGSTPAAQQDLDGDGDLDAGSNNDPSAAGFLAIRSSSPTVNGAAAAGGGAEFKIADVSFEVTSLLGGASTQLNYRPRQRGGSAVVALWKEDGSAVLKNVDTGTLLVGAPVVVHSSGVSEPASLRGNVFNDLNASGKRDVSEPGLANWGVYLDLNQNAIRDANEPMALTNASGTYTFTGLSAGQYRVRELLYPGYRRVTPGAGFYDVQFSAVGQTTVNAFGNTKLGFIRGTIFKDVNGNGRRDSGESGLSGFRVWDDSNGNSILDANEASTLTDGNGNYTLNVASGWHTIRVQSKTGYRQTGVLYYKILTGDSTRVYDKLFGEKPLA
jgi:hypothetical protein